MALVIQPVDVSTFGKGLLAVLDLVVFSRFEKSFFIIYRSWFKILYTWCILFWCFPIRSFFDLSSNRKS